MEVRHYAGDNSWSIRVALCKEGISQKSFKPYTTWTSESFARVRPMRLGRQLRTVREGRDTYSSYRYPEKSARNGTFEAIFDLLLGSKPPQFNTVAPLAEAYGLSAETSERIVSAFVDTQDITVVTRRLFGVRRYRKDLARAVAQAANTDRSQRVFSAVMFRHLVPVDWLVAHINGRGPAMAAHEFGPGLTREIVAHLKHLDQRSLRRLILTQQGRVPTSLLTDFSSCDPHPDVSRVDSWLDLHDRVLEMPNRHGLPDLRQAFDRDYILAESADFTVKHPARIAAIEGVTAGGYRIELATCGTKLRQWSDQMHHCIDTYMMQMHRGTSVLGAVHSPEDELLANFELSSPRASERSAAPTHLELKQLLGKYNMHLDRGLAHEIEAHLSHHGVRVDQYWGQPARDETAA